jgi:carbon storage regulator
MLVLTRKLGESIAIDDHIKIIVVQIKGKQVRLGVQADLSMPVHREEIYEKIREENQLAQYAEPRKLDNFKKLDPNINTIEQCIKVQDINVYVIFFIK